MNEKPMNEESLFERLVNAPETERPALLAEACGDNLEFKNRMENLLRAYFGSVLPDKPFRRKGIDLNCTLHDSNANSRDEPLDEGAVDGGHGSRPNSDPPGSRQNASPSHRARLGRNRSSNHDLSTMLLASNHHAGTEIAGRYKLLQQIGEGGMGTVWMADQYHPVKRRVAVKLVRADRSTSQQILARFEAERQAIAMMDHSHIARLLDAGTTDEGAPFFVMELVKGIPLTDFCDQAQLDLHERLNIFMQVCGAVQHAHQKGIIHRDLKPSNILVENHDGRPVPKIIDFGLAKASSGMQLSEQTLFTGFGAVMGTPMYMAPEQIGGSAIDIDTRADIYALGVILYELLTGSPPLSRETLKEVALDQMVRLIREHEPLIPSSRLSSSGSAPNLSPHRQAELIKQSRQVRGDLDWIVMRALAKERDRRYDTPNSLASDLERFLNHQPVVAGPPTMGYRLRKFVRRNRLQVTAAALVLLALIGGMVGTAIGMIEANRQAEIAKQEAQAKEIAWEAESAQRQIAETRAQEANEARQAAEQAAELERQARLEAEREREAKEQEKQFAWAIADFVRDDFLALTSVDGQFRFGGAVEGYELSKNTTLRQLLDRAAHKLKARTDLASSIEANLRWMIGENYRGLGDYLTAIEFLERSLNLHRDAFGEYHESTLTAQNSLASAYASAGEPEKALTMFESVLAWRKEQLGPFHADTLATMGGIAQCLSLMGRLQQAVELHEDLRKSMLETYGAGYSETLLAQHRLACSYQEAGQLHQAHELFEKTYEQLVAQLGESHPYTVNCQSRLASSYFSLGDWNRALKLYQAALAHQRKIFEEDHPYVYTAMHDLALCLHAAGHLDQALPLYRDVYDWRKLFLGFNHPETLTSMDSLALGLFASGDLTGSHQLWDETLTLSQSRRDADHPANLALQAKLAASYHQASLFDRAIDLYEQTLDQMTRKLGADHPDTLTQKSRLANVYHDAQRVDEAIEIYNDVIEGQRKLLGEEHFETLSSRSGLATCYFAIGEKERGLKLHLETLNQRESRLGADHPHTLISLNNVANSYRLMGRMDEALTYYERTIELMKAKEGDDHPHTIVSMAGLADLYSNLEDYEKAVPLWETTLRLMRDRFGNEHLHTMMAMNMLSVGYTQMNRTDEALKLNEELFELASQTLGAEHPNTLMTAAGLGVNYCDVGRYEEAIERLEFVHEKIPEEAGRPLIVEKLLTSYQQLRRVDDYLNLAQQLQQAIREQAVEQAPQLAELLELHGRSLLDMQGHSQAEPMLRECLEIRKKIAPEQWITFDTMSLLGESLIGQPNPQPDLPHSTKLVGNEVWIDEVERLLTEGFEGLVERQDSIPTDYRSCVIAAIDRLINLYHTTDRPEQAAQWKQRRSSFADH
jgi:serine/threonine protein kinase/tetratricopeptide (TPR) repeat protein